MTEAVDISVDFAGIRLANPVSTASGTCGYADELADFMDVNTLGAFITKSITLEPRRGNATPRIVETDAGMYADWYLPNVRIMKKAMLKKQYVAKIMKGGTRSASNSFHVRVRSAPPGSPDAEKWAAGQFPVPVFGER